MRGTFKIVLGAGVIAGTVALGLGPALADPPAGVTPAATDIVSVGSDTIQAVEDKLSIDYNSTNPTNPFYSYDATPAGSTITPKAGCATITRPNGSGAGIAALKAGAMTGSNYCVDIARSSRGPAAGDGSAGALAFVPFALDAVTWSANATTNAPVSLTTNQLKAIYSCDASILGGNSSGPVTWDEVGGTGNDQVVPVIPQSASGTRAFFLSKIGVTTLGSCVVPTDNSVEENEGTNAIFRNSNANDEVFPYSVAVYFAQSVYKHGKGNQGNLVLHQVNGVAPVVNTKVLNKNFPYTRDVYNVVRDSGTSTHVPAYLQPLLGSGSNSGYLCTNSKAKGDIKNYGFALLGAKCGKPVIAPAGS